MKPVLSHVVQVLIRQKVFFLLSLLCTTTFPAETYAQECGYVYITPTGASSGAAGTRANPANLAHGLTLTSSSDNIVRLSSGTYTLSSEFTMIGNITMEGGYNSSTWVKSNITPTIFHRDTANILSSPSRLIAFSCIGISNFRILDITITMDDAAGNGISTYGIYLNSCSNFTLSRCIIDIGDASNGFQGAQGNPGTTGVAGTGGESGTEEGDCCTLSGIGGSGSFSGSNAGGGGGPGAERPVFSVDTIAGFCYSSTFVTRDGYSAYPGLGMGGAQGGVGGDGVCELVEYVSTSCAATTTNHGATGDDGTVGYNGLNGLQAYGSFTGGFYAPATGLIGTQATHGGGGGGGGGGGAKGCEPVIINPSSCDTVFWSWGAGGGGGGGGEGGQGGFSGLGGEGGGSSFCIFTWNCGVNGQVRDCYMTPGTAGIGGVGGPGGFGGLGGAGGLGGTTGENILDTTKSCNTGEGGIGGIGGAGGVGGVGGTGSDGLSYEIYEDTAGYPMLVSNAYNPFEPPVTVDFSGCSNSNIIFGTTATGNVDWIYGFGSNPPGSANAIDTTQYASGTLGSRTITLIVDGVPYTLANFITLNTEYAPPTIDASELVICSGDDMTLTSTGNADTYIWTIAGGATTTSTVQNPGAIAFNAPGTYMITLETTSCCGLAYTEQEIVVIDSVGVDIGTDTSVCFTDVLPTFDAGNPGATYAWTLNALPIGGNTQTLQASAPGNYGVSVSYGSCTGYASLYFNIFTSLPVDLGADTSICLNDPFPTLDAGIPDMSYSWTLDGNPIGMNAQTLATTLPGTYSVLVTSATGCQGVDSLTVTLSEPTVGSGSTGLGSDKSICDNEPFPVLNAGNPGSTYFWFLDGLVVGIDSMEHQTITGGIYSVVIVNEFGCTASDSITLTVLSALTGSLVAPATANVSAPVSFSENSGGGVSWNWNFGDGGPNDTTQNPTNTYTTAGIYPVFVIVGNGVCYDTVITSIEILNDCGSLTLTSAFSPTIDTIDIAGLGVATFTNSSTNDITWLWDFGDGTPTSSAQNPNHAFTDTGIFTVTLTIYNYNCSDVSTGTIVVINSAQLPPVDTTTIGIFKPIEKLSHWNVYPNPNDGVFYIEASLVNEETYFLELYNLVGEMIFQEKIKSPGNYNTKVDLNGESKGIYMLKLRSSDNYSVKKIIVH